MSPQSFANRPSEPHRKYVTLKDGKRVKNIAYRGNSNSEGSTHSAVIQRSKSIAEHGDKSVANSLVSQNWEPRMDTPIPDFYKVDGLHKGLEILYRHESGLPIDGVDPKEIQSGDILSTVGKSTTTANVGSAEGSKVTATLKSLDLIDDDLKLTSAGHSVLGAGSKSQRDQAYGYMFSKIPETGMSRVEREKVWKDDLSPATKESRHRSLDHMAKLAESSGFKPEPRTADGIKRTSTSKTVEEDIFAMKPGEAKCSNCGMIQAKHLVHANDCESCN